VAIGGFWAMSTATAMRLVPADKVPKALAVIFSSVSIATVVAAPLGSYLGSLIGWRNVLFSAFCRACWRCSGSCGCCLP
jgi:predicted MFS family arabinose efflux permease